VKLFFDNNLPPRTARALHCLLEPDGHRVVHLRDLFKADEKDTDWIAMLGREGGWVIFTSDHDIVRRKAEKLVWHQQRLVAFILSKGWQSFGPLDQCWRLIKRWPEIEAQVRLAAPGSVYLLTPSSRGKIGTL
jgi:hypothetical protein